MLTLTSHKTLFIWIALILAFIIFLFLPIRINYNLSVKGKILPAREWVIYKGTDGRLTSQLINYKTGMSQSYDVTLFDRGDAMQFAFDTSVHSGSKIKVNDTIAVVYSNEIERQIENLKGQIISAKASLSLNLTGEKQAVIDEENKNLDYAFKQAEEQKKILDRMKVMYEKGLVSQEEYEITKGSYDLNLINISISKAKLQNVETGAKQEQIGFIKSQIVSLESELAVLKKRFEGFTITSPLDGIVIRKTNSDTLMTITDDSELILINPVKVNDKRYIIDSADVLIYANGVKQNVKARIFEIDNSVKIVNGIQVITVTSLIDGKTSELIPNLIVDCYIHTGKLSPLDYLIRVWQRIVN
ncbi:MAG TPA: hypothetical protein DHV28_18925 [Ignavibacteriales bacterium]|nr:hypothetical protein [Ignavibacteriales bacterium]